MTGARVPRSGADIRSRFIERLNLALLRPGMYGGETALLTFLDDLAWIDGRDDSASHVLGSWGTWSPAGIAGWAARLFGGAPRGHGDVVAFTCADLAHHWGYLRPERGLDAREYARLRGSSREWTAAADRKPADVTDAFGAPSLGRASYNPLYPLSLAYAPGSGDDPLVIFDFWQDTDWDSRPPAPRLGPEPVLRAVRWREPGTPMFTFTPAGESLRAAQPG